MKMAVYATCGKQRCLQERKQLRKELERGRKNLVSFIGLETIIEGIYGAEFLGHISPFRACDDIGTEDWQGEKENCPLCQARQEIVQETIARHESYLGSLLDNKDHHISQEERLRRAQQWLTESVYQATSDITEEHLDEIGQQKLPLDLSRSAAAAAAAVAASVKDVFCEELSVPKAYPTGQKPSQEPLKVPAVVMHKTQQTKAARPARTVGSSNYTQDDLKLALQEVRQGKLGTRRAAMLYGIPRSTIRNHLHRMRDKVATVEAEEPKDEEAHSPDANFDSNDNAAKLRNFLRSRARGGSGKSYKMTKLQKCLDQAIIKELVNSCAFKKVETKEDTTKGLKETYEEHSKKSIGLPKDLFEHLIVRLIEVERVQSLSSGSHKKKAAKYLKDTSLLKQPSLATNVDMKVPDFKAMLASMNPDSPIGNPVKKSHGNSHSTAKEESLGMPSCISKSGFPGPFSANNNNNQGALNEEDYDYSSNRRAKRGKYRCYNGDSLLQAVDTVERGEMSIARASNIFGIPHSTLEYKVRERQIRRQQGATLEHTARSLAMDPLGIHSAGPAGFYVTDFGGSRPFHSFAEKLRAMSEKQAMQNRYGFSHLDGQLPLLLAPGLAGDASAALAVADPAYYLLSKSPNPLPVPLPPSLRDQWALWAQKPLLGAPFFGLYHPAGFMVDPTGMGMVQPDQPSSSKKPSMGDAINRLVEAHIYDSLQQGKSSNSHSPTSSSRNESHDRSSGSGERGTLSSGVGIPSESGQSRETDSRSNSRTPGQKRPLEDAAESPSVSKKPSLE